MQPDIYKISIPKPCHQVWDEMQPINNGKHCDFCKKDVIDFSKWTNNEIQNYIISNQNIELCGRFKVNQLDKIRIVIPNYVFQKKLPFWKYFLILVLISFGTSFLSINTEIGSNFTLKAQTTHNNKNKEATKHKHKKQKNKVPISDWCTVTMGLIGYDPEITFKRFNDLSKKTNGFEQINTFSQAPIPKKDLPNDTKKENNRLYILAPTVASFRRKKKIKLKDIS